MMGILGGDRGYLHRGMDNALSDVSTIVKSHITIIDATRILLRHGPQGGSLSDVKVLNKMIASTDIVAADAYATTLFDLKPEDISTTVTAYKRGLGEMNLSKIKVEMKRPLPHESKKNSSRLETLFIENASCRINNQLILIDHVFTGRTSSMVFIYQIVYNKS